eukprot:351105-Chlamydomonas_euryale.AAC.3
METGPKRARIRPDTVPNATRAPTSVHLRGLALQLRDFDLGRDGWIRRRDVKLKVEFVLDQVVHIPAAAAREALGRAQGRVWG